MRKLDHLSYQSGKEMKVKQEVDENEHRNSNKTSETKRKDAAQKYCIKVVP